LRKFFRLDFYSEPSKFAARGAAQGVGGFCGWGAKIAKPQKCVCSQIEIPMRIF